MRLSSLALAAGAVLFAVLNVGSTFARSTIPYAMHGQIEQIELRFEKHRGVDDVYLVTVAGRAYHVDRAVGIRLERGDRIDKQAWSTRLRTPRETVRLRPSADARRMTAVMPVAVLAALALTLAGVRLDRWVLRD